MRESVSTFLDLLTRPEFLMGLAFGMVGFVALAALSIGRDARGWGIVLVAPLVYGVQIEEGATPALTTATILMAIGGGLRSMALRDDSRRRWLVPAWLFIGGGAAFSTSLALEYTNPLFGVATFGVAVAIGWALSTWENGPHRIALGPRFAVSAFGIWTTVPDTDLARILLGIAIPMAFTTVPPFSVRISGAGAFALAAALAWLPLWGGDQRTGSVIGAWACIGMIALFPLALRLLPDLRIAMWQLIGLHIGAVLVSARVIGLWDRATLAAGGVALLGAAILGVVLLIHRGQLQGERHANLHRGSDVEEA
ncbi:MAG: hypothetical protein QNM02_19110 [Acidimicrobiia bacterium]|nr:hypothetical protein [Acidimicrobiia bacterium]